MKSAIFHCAAVLLASSICQTAVASAQRPSSPLILYDNFKTGLLDSSKWALTYNWCGDRVLECVREIQNNSLRMEVRSFGRTDSNVSNVYGGSELHFANPGPIRTFAAHLSVRRASVSGCSANNDTQALQTLLQGTFFNSGTNDPNDDVQAFLDIEHLAGDSVGQLSVIGFLHWQGQFFQGTFLGNVKVGQPGIAKLAWNRSNSQFDLSWTDLDTGIVTQGTMPYSMPDGAPAAAPDKLIAVRAFSPNCIGTSIPSSFGETKIEAVWVGMQ